MEQAFDELQKVLARVKAPSFVSGTLLLEDEDHGSVALRSYYAGLRKIFESWRPPVNPLTGALEGGLETVRRHYAGLTERFGYPIQPPEGLVNGIGYVQLAQGRSELALEAFRLNAANYPESANVHDSLGDGLDAAGLLKEARESYAKAVALGEKAKDPNLAVFRQHLENADRKLKPPSP
jgi:tetratricopeptide (TPR) repeat protein